MRLSIKVISRARKPRIESVSLNVYRVYVSAPREKGKANEALIGALARYFAVPRTHIRILRGVTSANKIVEVGR
ncbi:MAG: DUF167 domain-containing protein [Candidatus Sungbacteria bacterium]|nr:DUF167 domain-containing protein [Candidatus Sungbacteria bacterium]